VSALKVSWCLVTSDSWCLVIAGVLVLIFGLKHLHGFRTQLWTLLQCCTTSVVLRTRTNKWLLCSCILFARVSSIEVYLRQLPQPCTTDTRTRESIRLWEQYFLCCPHVNPTIVYRWFKLTYYEHDMIIPTISFFKLGWEKRYIYLCGCMWRY
jgi:hypothetical protein